MTDELWHGIDVDFWAPIQTLTPAPKSRPFSHYAGFEHLVWWDGVIEEIPLGLRFASFKRRLAKAMAK